MSEKQPNRLYSKRELEREFRIADTTVYRTLKCCGLPTRRRRYTQQEVKERFCIARQLFKAGLTCREVKDYFGIKPVEYTIEIKKLCPTQKGS